ncbi:MAG: hypothetical protein KAU01_04930 [Candidatus Cloacimonetes bacterium]|nr:hypothetical protein [Candidatus Cloacimonadota bacterium]
MKKKRLILILGLTLFFCSLIFAGPNENAAIVFDMDATTYGNQNLTGIPSQPVGTYIRLDVYCTEVHNLDTYEFEVVYNPTELEYVTATATNPITFEGNILESNGGTALGWMIDTSTPGVLSIAYTLAGTDTLEAPEGEGLIADIVFISLVETYGTLSFGDVYYYDSDGVMDVITDKGTAALTILPPDPPENVNINIVADGDSVKITWDNEGLEYNIYSDDEPNGSFNTLEATVTDIGEVIINTVGLKKFYRISANN